jgi:hypothetical protein
MTQDEANFIARRAVKQGGYADATPYYSNSMGIWYVCAFRLNGGIARWFETAAYRPEWWGH